ncbi:capsid protein [Mesorhizobium sp. M7A.F.Ca.MR.362.00.0.0]|nr:capsid protein [Mesorhizobium sp. M7A.F.Ca.MR.362.00.0.0]
MRLAHCGSPVTPSPRTLRAELLRLCARIGYSPPLCL